jgi:diguanylate cyclase (GGDEF)-like protein
MAAGLGACAVCTIVSALHIFDPLRPITAALLTIGCGWVTLLVAAPWRLMRGLHADHRSALRALNQHIRDLLAGQRSVPLQDLIIEQDDEIGDLSRAVHGLASEALARRQHTRLLHRRMDRRIQRETRRATADLERQVTTDPLTGLGNRRALEQRLGELCGSSSTGGCELSVVAIDLDMFKQINDTLGHDAGDKCLVFLGNVLKAGLRRDDLAIRLGGDEFLVLMPNQSLEEARAAAGRLAALYSQIPWPHVTSPKPTLSCGVAWGVIACETDVLDLLRRADAALYDSKRANRTNSIDLRRRGAA